MPAPRPLGATSLPQVGRTDPHLCTETGAGAGLASTVACIYTYYTSVNAVAHRALHMPRQCTLMLAPDLGPSHHPMSLQSRPCAVISAPHCAVGSMDVARVPEHLLPSDMQAFFRCQNSTKSVKH